MLKNQLITIALALVACISSSVSATDDPVARFIAQADSLARTGDVRGLESFVRDNSILCGAVVGQLLDEAVRAGDGGDRDAERARFSLAGRIADMYREATGSRAPLDLVRTYRGWGPERRALRARAKSLEDEATRSRKAGDLDKAVGLLEEARTLYQKINDKRSIAVVWGSLGVAHWSRNDWEAVRRCYEKALEERRAIEDRILEGRTLNGFGSLNFQTGNNPAAIGFYDQAEKLRRKTGDLAGLGTSLTYMGNAYLRLGRLAEARDKFNEALVILEKGGTTQQMIEVLNGSANASFEMGRLREACETYRRAIEISEAAQDRTKEVSCLLNLGDALRFMGRYRESLVELEKAGEILALAPNPQREAELSRNRGNVYSEMGELDRARDEFLAYLSKSRELGDLRYQGEAFIQLGLLYRALGAHALGLACADSVRVMADRAGNTPLLLDALMLSGDIEHAEGQGERALEHYRQVVEGAKAQGFELDVLNTQARTANVLAALGRREEARNLFRNIDSSATALGINMRWKCQFGIADTYERENPDSAYWHYERAFRLLEESRTEIGAAETQTGFFSGDRRRLFEEVTRYYASLENGARPGLWSARAFTTIERGKARGLLDLLERSVGAQSSPEEEAVLDSLYRLNKEAPEYREREAQLKDHYSELREARIGRSLGALGLSGGAVSLEDVRRVIPKGAVLLEYALGDTTSLLWAIDGKGSSIYRLPKRSVLTSDVERLCDAVSMPGAGDEILIKTARALYVSLLEPARERLAHAKRLVIVPDGALFELPFEILLTREAQAGREWKKQPFLVRSFTTTYAPSASVFFKLMVEAPREVYPLELLALGDPDFTRLAPRGDGDLRPLPYSRAEVENIGVRLDRKREALLVGADANEGNLKKMLGERTPRILHLATHGLIDPVEPINSCVVLSPSESPKEDGRLYTLEILSLPVAPDLVVMSACESAKGVISGGEGVVGLSRAFLASGARGVVASLWSVSDASTAEFMREFYGAMLGSRKRASDGIREARLKLMNDSRFSHPFYWSPFITIGAERTPW